MVVEELGEVISLGRELLVSEALDLGIDHEMWHWMKASSIRVLGFGWSEGNAVERERMSFG